MFPLRLVDWILCHILTLSPANDIANVPANGEQDPNQEFKLKRTILKNFGEHFPSIFRLFQYNLEVYDYEN